PTRRSSDLAPGDLGERTEGSHHRGEELLRRQIGLRFVVVDVEAEDDLPLGRLTRLPGQQDDPDVRVLQFAPDLPSEHQSRILALHDDIQKHDRDIGPMEKNGFGLGRRPGGKQLDTAAKKHEVPQDYPSHRGYPRIVVDDENAPDRPMLLGRGRIAVLLEEQQRIVLRRRDHGRFDYPPMPTTDNAPDDASSMGTTR